MDKSSSLGMPMSRQEISNKYKRQSLGMPQGTPSSSTKYQVIFQDTKFLLLHMLCVFLGASLFLLSVFFLFLFAEINGWTPTCFFWRRHALFSLPRTL
jgi:hypothetical protein